MTQINAYDDCGILQTRKPIGTPITNSDTASLGRFLQPDSIGYEDGVNIHACVGGDPLGLNEQEIEVVAENIIVVAGSRERGIDAGSFPARFRSDRNALPKVLWDIMESAEIGN